MIKIELRRIEYFVAVAKELHFTRAAEKIGIAQPALSQQIKLLEEELGAKLLERSKRKVYLTVAGEVFLKEAEKLLNQSAHAQSLVKRSLEGQVGELKIGFVEAALWNTLPQMIKQFRKNYPDVLLNLKKLNTDKQLYALENKEIDIGFTGLPIEENTKYAKKIIRNDSLLVAMYEEHPLAVKEKIGITDILHEALIVISREKSVYYYDRLLNVFLEEGNHLLVAQEVDNFQTMLSLVSSGLGIALIPESVHYLRGDILYRKVEGIGNFKFPLSMIYRKEENNIQVSNFVSVLN